MTSSETCERRKGIFRKFSGQTLFLLLWGLVWFALADPQLLAKTATDALALCIRQVIPVLFPIAAAGGLLVSFAPPSRRLCRWIGRPFRLSDASVGVLLISLVSGFPLGAMLASRLREARRIGQEEASRLAAYTNNASAAFLVGCVGKRWFGSAKAGWILWISSIASALLIGLWMARRAPHPAAVNEEERPLPGAAELANALKTTGQGMLYLTVFVVFFAVFGAFLDRLLATLLPEGSFAALVQALIAAVFELTRGSAALAALPLSLPLRMGLVGAATGFGSLSVFMQCMAAGKAVRGERLLQARLAIGAASGTLALLLTLIFS